MAVVGELNRRRAGWSVRFVGGARACLAKPLNGYRVEAGLRQHPASPPTTACRGLSLYLPAPKAQPLLAFSHFYPHSPPPSTDHQGMLSAFKCVIRCPSTARRRPRRRRGTTRGYIRAAARRVATRRRAPLPPPSSRPSSLHPLSPSSTTRC